MQAVVRFLLGVLSLAAGTFAIVVAVLPQTGVEVATQLTLIIPEPGSRVAAAAAGALLVILPLTLTLRWWMGRRYAREISYPTDAGRVSVSLVAIEEALTRAVEAEPVVRKVQTRLYEDRVKRGVVIEAALTLWDDGDVSTANRRCQDLIRRRFGELMPEQRSVQVHLTVHRLSHRREDTNAGEAARGATVGRSATTITDAHEPVATAPAAREHVPLPGLSTTHGGVDSEAGKELLRASRIRRRRSDDTTELIRNQPEAGADPIPVETAAAGVEAGVGEDDSGEASIPYEDLYAGPNYLVDDEDDDSRESPAVKPS